MGNAIKIKNLNGITSVSWLHSISSNNLTSKNSVVLIHKNAKNMQTGTGSIRLCGCMVNKNKRNTTDVSIVGIAFRTIAEGVSILPITFPGNTMSRLEQFILVLS
tara:strand:- start:60 stop:374 length:315 start_codon:yes stop_codon:yes gene_type:complete